MKSADAGVELTVILCWNNNPLIAPIKSVAAPSSIDRNLDDISSPKASNWSVGTADLGRFGVLGEVALQSWRVLQPHWTSCQILKLKINVFIRRELV